MKTIWKHIKNIWVALTEAINQYQECRTKNKGPYL
jgi:hypothetical protein